MPKEKSVQGLSDAFEQIVNTRRSIRVYDTEAPFDHTAVSRSLARAVLAPNSSNMQLWEFYRIQSEDKKKRLSTYCFDQSAAKTAKELVVVVARLDKWRQRRQFIIDSLEQAFKGKKQGKREQMALDYYKKIMPMLYMQDPFNILGSIKKSFFTAVGLFRPIYREVNKHDVRVVAHKSAALAAQNFMLSMRAEGYDSCPMEGFDSKRVKKLLKLPCKAQINMIISVGVGKPEGEYGPRLRVPHSEVIFEV